MNLDEKSYGIDLSADVNTYGMLTFGAENAYGAFDYFGDTDWYHVRTDVGTMYYTTLVPDSPYDDPAPNAYFVIRDRYGNFIRISDTKHYDSGNVEQWAGVAVDTDYYIEVFSSSVGGYTVRVDSDTSLSAKATPFHGGDEVTGYLSATSQDDSYTVQLTAGTTYYAGLLSATVSDPFVGLENPFNETVLHTVAIPGQVYSYTATVTGTYTLHVSSNGFVGRGSYTLTGGDAIVKVTDVSTNQPSTYIMKPYAGPVAGLNDEFVFITPHNLNMSTERGSVFLHSGGGNDALQVTSGNNVLDGSTGSNFLVGGSGHDTFFVDDRAAPSDIWSTLVNFHGGDAATIWGVSAGNFAIDWQNNEGASGYKGLTLHASAPGRPIASATIVGYNKADLTNGRLSVSYGQVGGDNYMYVHGN